MTFSQRDIVLIPILFTDLSSNKKRPVIIISNDVYNENNPDIVVVALTSNLAFDNEYCVEIDNHNLEKGRLPLKSQIRCDKIYTLSKDIVVKKFNKINSDTYELIKEKLNLLIENKSR